MNNSDFFKKMELYSEQIVGPVMFNYTAWIVKTAKKRGIKTIYFLARDGYLLYNIAKKIIAYNNIDIECKYFYCSRQSLRMPTYHIIGDEAYHLLLLGGYRLTPRSVLERASLSENELKRLYSELDIKDENQILNDRQFDELKEKIEKNEFYKEAFNDKSKAAYADTIAYLKQEGMFDCDTIAIADSGWTGSMQRSLRQLLESAGYKGNIIGFYFGMFVNPADQNDGEYLTYYFDANSHAKRKAYFSNNLFECMLSAPHAMTLRYKNENGKTVPVFTEDISDFQKNMAEAQINGALRYTEKYLQNNHDFPNHKDSAKKVYKILKKNMVYPSRDFVSVYGAFTFCDDVTEGYKMALASPEKRRILKDYMLTTRVFRKLFRLKKSSDEELFWPYGVIAFCPAFLRPFYRLNVKAWEIMKAILKK